MGHCPVKEKRGLLKQGGPAKNVESGRDWNMDEWINSMKKEM
jgi:hypothetical protein